MTGDLTWTDIAAAISGMIQSCGDIAFNEDGGLSEVGAKYFAEGLESAKRDNEMRALGIDPLRQWLENVCQDYPTN